MNKLVSIIVPIYNVESYLKKCLDTLLEQTYTHLEIILVNDGSTDRSQDIIEHYASLDNRIKAYTKKNGGLSDARNFGLKKANGEFCFFVDSDDTIAAVTIDEMMKSQVKYHSDIVVCDMEYIYEDRKEFASGGEFDHTSFKQDRNIIFINNSACNKLYRTSLFQDIQFPVGLWYEDLATIPILLSKAKMISKVNQPFYFYYQRQGSIAHTIHEKIFDIYKAIFKISNYYKTHEIDHEIDQLYIHHGLYLTTIRIKNDAENPVVYWEKNVQCMDKYYPKWRKIVWFKKYGMKENLIFKCLQFEKFNIVKTLYRR